MASDGHLDFLQFDIVVESYVVDAIATLDVLTLQAIDNGSAHNSYLILGFFDQGISLDETGTHVETEFDDVAFLPLTRDCKVGFLAIHLDAVFVAPIGLVQDDGGELLGFLDGELDFAIPRIVGLLRNLEVLGLQAVLAVEIDIEGVG